NCHTLSAGPYPDITAIHPDFGQSSGYNVTRFWGFRPDPSEVPGIFASDVMTLIGTLPAISNTSVPYPFMWGGQVYKLVDWFPGSQVSCEFVSNHNAFTYGQDLTTTNIPGLS